MNIIRQLPNFITTINMTLGLSILLLIAQNKGPIYGNLELYCLLILIGAFLDAIDGKLARYLNSCSNLGKQLDSFADLVTFGIAPIVVLWKLPFFDGMAFLILSLYPLGGAFRLARYNIGEFKDYFIGLPITAAGTIISLYTLALIHVFGHWSSLILTLTTLSLVLVLVWLMVSNFKIHRINWTTLSSIHALRTRFSNQNKS